MTELKMKIFMISEPWFPGFAQCINSCYHLSRPGNNLCISIKDRHNLFKVIVISGNHSFVDNINKFFSAILAFFSFDQSTLKKLILGIFISKE